MTSFSGFEHGIGNALGISSTPRAGRESSDLIRVSDEIELLLIAAERSGSMSSMSRDIKG